VIAPVGRAPRPRRPRPGYRVGAGVWCRAGWPCGQDAGPDP